MKKVIIVGGVAGGATTAAQLRRINQDINITIYDKARDVSFATCGMPYQISGEVHSRDQLIAYTKEKFHQKSIDVHTYHEVIQVDSDHNKVLVKNLISNTIIEDYYDYLVLSPGAYPRQLPALKDVDGVFQLHNLEHLDNIMTHVKLKPVQHALIIGSGFVSLEVLEALVLRGVKVSLVHRSNHIYSVIEKEFADELLIHLKERGVDVYLNAEVKNVESGTVTLSTGETVDSDMIFSGVGIMPNTQFLNDSNIVMNDEGYIPINEYCQTNIENVYALGDAVITNYSHVDARATIALAWPAHRMAYLIANHLSDKNPEPLRGLVGSQIIRMFDYDIASVGLPLNMIKNYNYSLIEHTQRNMSGYMPKSRPIHLKVYYEQESGKILRAAIFGEDKVDKMADTLSAHMYHDGSIYTLINLEPAYAPSFSSPKSVLNMIGYKALEKRDN